jgi:hypothetical protein
MSDFKEKAENASFPDSCNEAPTSSQVEEPDVPESITLADNNPQDNPQAKKPAKAGRISEARMDREFNTFIYLIRAGFDKMEAATKLNIPLSRYRQHLDTAEQRDIAIPKANYVACPFKELMHQINNKISIKFQLEPNMVIKAEEKDGGLFLTKIDPLNDAEKQRLEQSANEMK